MKPQTGNTPANITIDATSPSGKVSPLFYGLMTEEINHSYDGGLYAELVRNRAFVDDAASPAHWAAVQGDGAAATIALDTGQPLNDTLVGVLAPRARNLAFAFVAHRERQECVAGRIAAEALGELGTSPGIVFLCEQLFAIAKERLGDDDVARFGVRRCGQRDHNR